MLSRTVTSFDELLSNYLHGPSKQSFLKAGALIFKHGASSVKFLNHVLFTVSSTLTLLRCTALKNSTLSPCRTATRNPPVSSQNNPRPIHLWSSSHRPGTGQRGTPAPVLGIWMARVRTLLILTCSKSAIFN